MAEKRIIDGVDEYSRKFWGWKMRFFVSVVRGM
jgi:hypothetical protein